MHPPFARGGPARELLCPNSQGHAARRGERGALWRRLAGFRRAAPLSVWFLAAVLPFELIACRTTSDAGIAPDQDAGDGRYRALADSILSQCTLARGVLVMTAAQSAGLEPTQHLDGEWGNGAQRIVAHAWFAGDTLTVLLSTWGKWIGPHIALRMETIDGVPSKLLSAGVRHLRQHRRPEDAATHCICGGVVEVIQVGARETSERQLGLRLDLSTREDGADVGLHAPSAGRDIGTIRGQVLVPLPSIHR